jgi:ribosomal protein L11 methyltransferase
MPYRIDVRDPGGNALDRLVELGALDAESLPGRGMAALMPNSVTPEQVAGVLGVADVEVSPAEGRDAGSVWVLSARPIRIGSLRILPSHFDAEPGAIRLIDAVAFGTGLHPTTALCLEALADAQQTGLPDAVLDVGTGSGVLALAALRLGVPRATALDIDDEAMRVAAENARLNGFDNRLQLTRGRPEALTGVWPLVLANILAAPLVEMAPALVRRVGHDGRLVLSGIPQSVEADVAAAYLNLGMRRVDVKSRGGWAALVLQASW